MGNKIDKNKLLLFIKEFYIHVPICLVIAYIFTFIILHFEINVVFNKSIFQYNPLEDIMKLQHWNDYFVYSGYKQLPLVLTFGIIFSISYILLAYSKSVDSGINTWKNRTDLDLHGSSRLATTNDVKEWDKDKYTDIKLVPFYSYKKMGDKIFTHINDGGGAVLGKLSTNPKTKNSSNLKSSSDDLIINTGDNNTVILGATRSGKGVTSINPTIHNLGRSKGKIYLNTRRDISIWKTENSKISIELLDNLKNKDIHISLKYYFSEYMTNFVDNDKVIDPKTKEEIGFFDRFPIYVENIHDIEVGDELSKLILYIEAPNQNVLIPDFKGELLKTFGGFYKLMGYNVVAIDFINPLSSSSFNIMSEITKSYKKFIETYYLCNELKKDLEKEDDEEIKQKLKIEILKLNKTYRENKDYGDSSIRKIGSAIFPSNKDDEPWNTWAKNAFQASMFVAVIEMLHLSYNTKDIELKEKIEKSININTCINTFQRYFSSGKDMKNFYSPKNFHKRHKFINESDTFIADLKSYLEQPDSTKGNINGNIATAISIFSSNVKYCFSENDFSLDDLVGFKPTAIFIPIPEDKALYKFATIFINLIWDKVRLTVKKMKGAERLPINLNIILDEFGNLPKLEAINEMISAGLSMGVKLYIATQTIKQIDKVYGTEDTQTIINNCRNFIYIETPDEETREFVSKRVGNMTVEEKNWIAPKNKKDKGYVETKIVQRRMFTTEDLLYESNNKRQKFDILSIYINKPVIYSDGVIFFDYEDPKQLRQLSEIFIDKTDSDVRMFNTFNIVVKRTMEEKDDFGDIRKVKRPIPLVNATLEEIGEQFEEVI